MHVCESRANYDRDFIRAAGLRGSFPTECPAPADSRETIRENESESTRFYISVGGKKKSDSLRGSFARVNN